MVFQTTTGFMDAMANYLSGVTSLGLTKGTNLFAENHIDDPDLITDQFILFDAGNEQIKEFRHIHLNWNIRVLTTRKTRISAAESLRPILNHIVSKKHFTVASDDSEKFKVLTTRVIDSPELTSKTETGRFASQIVLQFEVIPY